MPYAPTVNDNSGQILAQGINQGIGSLAEGIQRSIAERKKKEEDRKAKEAVNAAGKGLFGEDFDVKDAKPEQYGTIINLAQQKRDEPMRQAEQRFKQAQIDNFALQAQLQQSEAARRQSDDAAFRAVYGGQGSGGPSVGLTENQTGMTGTAPVQGGATAADANDVVSRFARGGGSLAAGSQLAAINASNASAAENQAQAAQRARGEQEFMPRVVDMGNGVKGMTTSRSSAVPINSLKADPNARTEFSVGGTNFVKQQGKLFNADTGELVGPAKTPDPDTQSRMAARLSAAQAAAEIPKGFFEGKADYEKRVSADRMKANQAAQVLGYQLPYPDAMPAKAGKGAPAPAGRVGAPSPAAKRYNILEETSK